MKYIKINAKSGDCVSVLPNKEHVTHFVTALPDRVVSVINASERIHYKMFGAVQDVRNNVVGSVK